MPTCCLSSLARARSFRWHFKCLEFMLTLNSTQFRIICTGPASSWQSCSVQTHVCTRTYRCPGANGRTSSHTTLSDTLFASRLLLLLSVARACADRPTDRQTDRDMHTQAHTHTQYTYAHTHIHAQMYAQIHAHAHAHTHAHTHTHTHTQMHAQLHMHAHAGGRCVN